MRTRRLLAASSLALVLGVTAAPLAGATEPAAPGDRAAAAGADHRATAAREALAEVEQIFAGTPAGGAEGTAGHDGDGREATLALRDLARLRSSLAGEDRARADRYLARPTDGPSDPGDVTGDDGYTVPEATPVCSTNICVHYVTSTEDAPPLTDANLNSIPDYVERTRDTVQAVHNKYVGAGYYGPKPDGTLGGNAKFDVYLENIGDDGLYGYVTSDQPTSSVGPWAIWAYAVFDNDYSPVEFGTRNTSTENLRVTAAHEYFHAVQYAYDFAEDAWFMEATATWVEDELYDSVNDNVFYLRYGQLGKPSLPLDTFSGLTHYGNWIFFRYLTEKKFPASQGGLPTIVRDMWRRADASSAAAPDDISTEAVRKELAYRGVSSFSRFFSQYGGANRRSRQTYAEGVSQSYPTPPLASSATLTRLSKSTGWRSLTTHHLTNRTIRVTPSSGFKASGWRARIELDMQDRTHGSAATLSVYKKSGSVVVANLAIDSTGAIRTSAPFSWSTVKYIEITLTNASTRFDPQTCWSRSTPYSCGGAIPLDDRLAQEYRITAFS